MWDLQKVILHLKMRSIIKGKNKREFKRSSILTLCGIHQKVI